MQLNVYVSVTDLYVPAVPLKMYKSTTPGDVVSTHIVPLTGDAGGFVGITNLPIELPPPPRLPKLTTMSLEPEIDPLMTNEPVNWYVVDALFVPPKTPALLNCSCVLDPPGVEPLAPPAFNAYEAVKAYEAEKWPVEDIVLPFELSNCTLPSETAVFVKLFMRLQEYC